MPWPKIAARLRSSSISLPAGPSYSGLTLLKEGEIQKWGNFMKGFSTRWLVLYPDRIAYCRSKEKHQTYKAAFKLHDIEVQREGNLSFLITNNDDINLKFKCENDIELHEWINAIEIARSKFFVNDRNKGEQVPLKREFIDHSELNDVIQVMVLIMDGLKSSNHMIDQHFHLLNHSLNDLIERSTDRIRKIRDVHLKASLLFWSIISYLTTLTKFMNLAQNENDKWKNNLECNIHYNKLLEDLVETMAHQQKYLKHIMRLDDQAEVNSINNKSKESSVPSVRLSLINSIFEKNKLLKTISERTTYNCNYIVEETSDKTSQTRRTSIPEKKDTYNIKFWDIFKINLYKDCIQKSIPVLYLEPLSMLQRLTGMFENSRLLDAAAESKDVHRQMAIVAAFVAASHSDHKNRIHRPFIPLLGETYECDREEEYGWRSIAEKVSLNPPIISQHCEGRRWTLWQNIFLSSKYMGKTLEITPNGVIHLQFDTGDHYTWTRLSATVHNIILGQMYISYKGKIKIVNYKTKDLCMLKFYPPTCLPKKSNSTRIIGVVKDNRGNPKWLINGTLEQKLEAAKIIRQTKSDTELVVKAHPPIILWEKKEIEDFSGRMYYFSAFDIQLNEKEEGIAPTDSRLRPDIKMLENGNANLANDIKTKLEANEKSRISDIKPMWFETVPDPIDDTISNFQYNGKYWEARESQDWGDCPNIFELA